MTSIAGQLLIHAHAHDGHTTVAVGTYLDRRGKSVHLHGENHLRQIADTFDSPAQAMLAFERLHAAEMRPGPAPLTDTERDAIAARSMSDVTTATATSAPSPAKPETVPVYLADAGNHDALLNTFVDAHGEFEKWSTWSDDTTHAIHESQTLRIEHVHEQRLTSACAERTASSPPAAPWGPVHLRLRGADPVGVPDDAGARGSLPPARSGHSSAQLRLRRRRFTSAHAERTEGPEGREDPVHLRLRGADGDDHEHHGDAGGSPPPGRSGQAEPEPASFTDRFTSACAERTRARKEEQ